MYRADSIAAYIVSKSKEIKKPVDNLKLQKLLYYAQGLSYIENGDPLFEDEIYAYMYGPVVKNVYELYRKNVGANIYRIENEEYIEDLDENSKTILDRIIETFKNYTSWDLVIKTHYEEPWSKTLQSTIISKDKIRVFFENKGSIE